ncbi:hypothetical protein DACRYDRAFT_105095 [Dacryopinax primogenitus]|uniref:Uncharacterized protein n=1 Tax=Dacryopinax primogenitus (strain DJM 731) TaxID=1858805 RepID=M5G741_DACPD|nr:uncharacterized protein DACRYDRAFT_105095 [Dacryopinax primogenitus]EJU04025.1 hypothetical protein DACRYDRAFT_105095 [Dacryopinax primogenitus]
MLDGALYIVVLRNAVTVNGTPINSWRLVLAGTPDICLYLDFDRTTGTMRPALRRYPSPEDGRPVPGRHIGGDARTLVTVLLPTQGAVQVSDLEAVRNRTNDMRFGRHPAEAPKFIATILKMWSNSADPVLDDKNDVNFNMLGAALSNKVAEAERSIAAGMWRGPSHFIYIPDGSEVLYSQMH